MKCYRRYARIISQHGKTIATATHEIYSTSAIIRLALQRWHLTVARIYVHLFLCRQILGGPGHQQDHKNRKHGCCVESIEHPFVCGGVPSITHTVLDQTKDASQEDEGADTI